MSLNWFKKNKRLKAGGLAIFVFCSFTFASKVFNKNEARDISQYTVLASKGKISNIINASGELRAVKTANIGPRKSGIIKEIYVDVGDQVKKGQILAKMDNEDFAFNIKEFKVDYEKEKSEFLSRKDLYQEGAISREDFRKYQNNFLKSEARYQKAKVEGQHYFIKAPFNGIITSKFSEEGSFVTPSTSRANSSSSLTKDSIIELSQGIELLAKVPESEIGLIEKGQIATVRIEAYPKKKFEAVLKTISPRAIKTNNVTSFEVILGFKQQSEILKIGMTADVNFISDNQEESIVVPTVAVVTEKGKSGLLILGENNQPKFKEVELGVSTGSKTAIIKGIEAGDTIFIDLPPWSKRKID
tara:strand:+ start:475 stop:1548 length:1074 start_codon:yes stop_codon:yes gene_type:complete